VPNDLRLAHALVELIEEEGARRLTIVYDEGIYGRELAGEVSRLARARGIETGGAVEDRDEPQDVRSLAENVAGERPDAVVYSGTAGTTFAALLAAFSRELPAVPVLGGTGLAAGGAPPGGPDRVAWLQPVRPESAYPREARRLLRRLDGAPPEALYGYESIRVVLDAVERVGADRRAVARSVLTPGPRRSPLGRYRVLRGGDVSEERLALFQLENRRLEFERLVR
jgi:ABC-type branched-subunit amino acid transport system substrate-binding protein